MPHSRLAAIIRSSSKLPLYDGHTDDTGSADVAFQVPDEVAAGQQLVIETISATGIDRSSNDQDQRDYRVLLTPTSRSINPADHSPAHVALSAFIANRRPANRSM